MFKEIAADRPYPETGLTTALWREVGTKYVAIAELIATQDHLSIKALQPTYRGSHSGDRLVHVVRHGGRLFLEDGHHRVVREALAGASHINARVLDMDREDGPVPPVTVAAVPSGEVTDVPGLVWVEGRGFRAVHLARALQAAGRVVDWHRWSPGTSDRDRALQYKDAV